MLGVVIGLAGALALTRVLVSRLYEISANDPMTFLVVAVILTLVGVAASIVPAIRVMGLRSGSRIQRNSFKSEVLDSRILCR